MSDIQKLNQRLLFAQLDLGEQMGFFEQDIDFMNRLKQLIKSLKARIKKLIER